MNTLFTNFGKPLFIVACIVVFTFQGYWLWNSFQNKKKEFLEQTKFEMTQVFMNKLIRSLPIGPKKIDSIFGPGKVSFTNIQSINNKSQIFIPNTKSKLKTKTTVKNKKNDTITIKDGNTFFKDGNRMDYILYNEIRSYIPELVHADITVYYESKKSKRTYPLNRSIKNTNTTEPIALLDHSTCRIHIENLNGIIITHKMLWPIIFSILYIILFLGTILILFRNLTLNQKLLKNKEIFTRNMTHELKIPISTLLIAAEGLEKYNIVNEPEGARKYAKSIQRASTQLSSLVETILQNTKADNNKEVLNLTRINLLTLLEEVKEILSGITIKSQAKVIFQDIDRSIDIKGNYEQMKQVFLNLLDNSLKYTEKQPVIIISAERARNRIIIKIEDNGIGIPEKYFQEVFKTYFRITNGDLHDVKGFGLGLSFVKSSLKKQNGSIRILKPESAGTVMELNLPLYES